MEIVDVVDENGKVLKQVTKEYAHKKGLLHKTVISEIINSKGEFILIKQSADRQDPGKYVSPIGGHVSAGETDEDALKREAQEEVGIANFTFKRIGQDIYERKVLGRHENHYYIVYEIYTDQSLTLGPEAISYKAFSKDALKKALVGAAQEFGHPFHFLVNKFYKGALV
jgi:8-oxo-dGTP pyrophosphatase MutT (NUDIX family)